MRPYSTATPDMTLPATSGGHLAKFEKTEFSGAAFCLTQPIGGLLVKDNHEQKDSDFF